MSSLRQDELPPCLECGACCFSHLETYVRVSGDDHARLGDGNESLTHWIGNRCYLQIRNGRCAALAVDRQERQFVCTIYDVRPETCRTLERGSPECLGERATKVERPGLALVREDAQATRVVTATGAGTGRAPS